MIVKFKRLLKKMKKNKSSDKYNKQGNMKESQENATNADTMTADGVSQENNVTENIENITSENEIVVENTTIDYESKINELNDKYLRLAAEFDNYRRRTLKEKMELVKSAGEDILINILPVLDNFERAQQAIKQSKEIDAVKEGIELIFVKFKEYLTQRGIKEIVSQDTVFNSDLHEALTNVPAPSEELKGKIVDVIEKGYYLNDKIIRFAKVVVGE